MTTSVKFCCSKVACEAEVQAECFRACKDETTHRFSSSIWEFAPAGMEVTFGLSGRVAVYGRRNKIRACAKLVARSSIQTECRGSHQNNMCRESIVESARLICLLPPAGHTTEETNMFLGVQPLWFEASSGRPKARFPVLKYPGERVSARIYVPGEKLW